jgi:hypothetical protein
MSLTLSLTAGPSARDVRAILKGAAGRLSGKTRGPDHATDHRVPRRNSYEENDPRAKPYGRLGDGSVKQGLIYKETLMDTGDALRRDLWAKYPRAEERRRKHEISQLEAELAQLLTLPRTEIPIGRPAAIRIVIAGHEAWLKHAEARLRRIDIDVLRGLLSYLTNFMTGALFPSHGAIAAAAGVHVNSVADGLKRLKHHGLIDWVRRTTKTRRQGEFGPQLEQTSNAYRLVVRRAMSKETWRHYWQRLTIKLRRGGAVKPVEAAPVAPEPVKATMTPLHAALASLGASVGNATT